MTEHRHHAGGCCDCAAAEDRREIICASIHAAVHVIGEGTGVGSDLRSEAETFLKAAFKTNRECIETPVNRLPTI